MSFPSCPLQNEPVNQAVNMYFPHFVPLATCYIPAPAAAPVPVPAGRGAAPSLAAELVPPLLAAAAAVVHVVVGVAHLS